MHSRGQRSGRANGSAEVRGSSPAITVRIMKLPESQLRISDSLAKQKERALTKEEGDGISGQAKDGGSGVAKEADDALEQAVPELEAVGFSQL